MENFLDALGHTPLHHIGPELRAVGGVADPAAPEVQVLPRRYPGHGAHGSDLLVPHIQAQDGVAVFLVLIDDGGDNALQLILFKNIVQGPCLPSHWS